MKDSFGGTIMMFVVIFFLAIYVFLIALTLRYAQAFKTKNKIIDIIEQYDGVSLDSDFVVDDIVNYLQDVNVKPNELLIEVVNNNDVRNTCFYKVSSSITWNWPFFDLNGVWNINGETKSVRNCNDIIIDDDEF